MCRAIVRDEDGCPVGEIYGYEDGFAVIGWYADELFEADPLDELDDEDLEEIEADDIPDRDQLPADDSRDYTHLFEPPPEPEDAAWWTEQCRLARGE